MPSDERNRLAVLGSPIAHSKSPVIHRAAYRVLGLDWEYEAVEVADDGLSGFVVGLGDSWRGLSLTMPLKRSVLPLLTERHSMVERVGGANTVLLDDSSVRGFNTDVQGAVESFRSVGLTRLDSALIIGAGATAASVLVACIELGATRVSVLARTPEKAAELVGIADRESIELVVLPWRAELSDAPDAVISTLPGGQYDLTFSSAVRESAVLFDVAYDPWPSGFAHAWHEVGGTVISGLELLLHQAIGQVRVFVSGDPDIPLPDEARVLSAMREALTDEPAA